MKTIHWTFRFLLLVLGLSFSAVATDDITSRDIVFEPGNTSASIDGTITGYSGMDYRLRASAGQTMHVSLDTKHTGCYFNVLPPGSEAALFIGSTSGTEWTGELPVEGVYTVRVYLMRSAARRGETAKYTITFGITGSPDAKVAGTPYHATGTVKSSVGTDPAGSSRCSFGVIRLGPGKAEVYLADPGFDVTIHKDTLRTLIFDGDSVKSSNTEETVTFEKKSDDWYVTVNDFHHYIIPDAVINGG